MLFATCYDAIWNYFDAVCFGAGMKAALEIFLWSGHKIIEGMRYVFAQMSIFLPVSVHIFFIAFDSMFSC